MPLTSAANSWVFSCVVKYFCLAIKFKHTFIAFFLLFQFALLHALCKRVRDSLKTVILSHFTNCTAFEPPKAMILINVRVCKCCSLCIWVHPSAAAVRTRAHTACVYVTCMPHRELVHADLMLEKKQNKTMSPSWDSLDSGTGMMITKKCCTEPAQVCKLPSGHFFPLVLQSLSFAANVATSRHLCLLFALTYNFHHFRALVKE